MHADVTHAQTSPTQAHTHAHSTHNIHTRDTQHTHAHTAQHTHVHLTRSTHMCAPQTHVHIMGTHTPQTRTDTHVLQTRSQRTCAHTCTQHTHVHTIHTRTHMYHRRMHAQHTRTHAHTRHVHMTHTCTHTRTLLGLRTAGLVPGPGGLARAGVPAPPRAPLAWWPGTPSAEPRPGPLPGPSLKTPPPRPRGTAGLCSMAPSLRFAGLLAAILSGVQRVSNVWLEETGSNSGSWDPHCCS